MLKNVETTNVDVEISRRYFYMNTRSLKPTTVQEIYEHDEIPPSMKESAFLFDRFSIFVLEANTIF